MIKVVLLPLGVKQIKSMQAMQSIQPKVKELQKKFKGNKAKIQEETMKLYKEAGVNPLGGCLPLLLQFPTFIAMYAVIRAPQLSPPTPPARWWRAPRPRRWARGHCHGENQCRRPLRAGRDAESDTLGGEQSGHIIFLEDSPAGDGLLTAVKVASLVALHRSLEELVAGLKDYPQTIVNVKVKTKPALEPIPEVARALREAETTLGENGRIVLRYSGTEPLARVMVEAEYAGDVERYSQSIASAIRATIGA